MAMEQKKQTRQERYKAKNIKKFLLELNKNTDTDLIEWLENQDKKQGMIKHALRKFIENNK